MSQRRIGNSLPAVFVFGLFLMAALPDAAVAAPSCKSWGFVGQGIANTKPKAQSRAVADWRKKVTDHWGIQWANWNIATHTWILCEPFRGRRTRCIANGVPCMPGLKLAP